MEIEIYLTHLPSKKMKASIAKKIAAYKFQEDLKIVYATPVGHLCLFSCFAFPIITDILTSPFAVVNLSLAILFFISIKLNNWQSHQLNLCFLFVYLLLLFGEWLFLGIPGYTIGFHQSTVVNKGALLEFFGGLLPFIYVGMRIFLIVPLIRMTVSSHRLNHSFKIND